MMTHKIAASAGHNILIPFSFSPRTTRLRFVRSTHNPSLRIFVFPALSTSKPVTEEIKNKIALAPQTDQHDWHKATCSLRYERQGQRRWTPGPAARQLNSRGWLCSQQPPSAEWKAGAKRLSRNTMDLHCKSVLKITMARSILGATIEFFCSYSFGIQNLLLILFSSCHLCSEINIVSYRCSLNFDQLHEVYNEVYA